MPLRSRQARRWRGLAPSAAATCSAASMPDSIALWLPLMRGTLTKPAAQPISAPPGNDELRHRLPAALGDGAGAVADALAAGESVADERMRLEALEFLERRQIRVVVIEMDDEADRNQIVVEVIEERAAAGAVVERPAERVLDEAAAVFVRRDLPQLLQADAEFLRLACLAPARNARSAFWSGCRARLRRTTCICRATPCRGRSSAL